MNRERIEEIRRVIGNLRLGFGLTPGDAAACLEELLAAVEAVARPKPPGDGKLAEVRRHADVARRFPAQCVTVPALVFLDAVAALEEATARPKPPGEAPVSDEREKAIRADMGPPSSYGPLGDRAVRDLVALLDHERARALYAEAWCQRLANDRECETALREAERAAVLGLLQGMIDEEDGYLRESPLRSRLRVQTLVEVKRALDPPVPAEQPPHEAALARQRRLEAALTSIVGVLDVPRPAEGRTAAIRRIIDEAIEERP